MKETIEKLRDWGCDTVGAVERMADDEEFYIECLQEVAQDPCFAQLRQTLQDGDVQGAFDAAHTLKGVLANVGLTPMYDKIVEIVEPLRAGRTDKDMPGKLAELERMKLRLADILSGK
ncbi:MAG: Hpt domain-containing protein [Oscillospiraceae bacterium]|nr:Hpt domain-containing protein [Oscillospiraceae bacterium]